MIARLKASRFICLEEGEPFRRAYASALFAGCRREHRLAPLAGAQVDDLRRLTDFQDIERVRVVVDVGDRLAGDLDDDVAFLQAGRFGWPAAYHAAEQETLGLTGVVRDRAGEDPH